MMSYKFLQHNFILASKESALLHLKLVLLLQFGGSLLMAVIMLPLVLRGMDTVRALLIAGGITMPAAFGLCWYMLADEFRDLNRGIWPMHNAHHRIGQLKRLAKEVENRIVPELEDIIAEDEDLLIRAIQVHKSALTNGAQSTANEAMQIADEIRDRRSRIRNLHDRVWEVKRSIDAEIVSETAKAKADALSSQIGGIRAELFARVALMNANRNRLFELEATV